MRNVIYPDGTGRVWIEKTAYNIDPQQVEALLSVGVEFWRFQDDKMIRAVTAKAAAKRKKRTLTKARSATRVCVYEVSTPHGLTLTVTNVRKFMKALWGDHSQWLYTKALNEGTIDGYKFTKIGYQLYSSADGTYGDE